MAGDGKKPVEPAGPLSVLGEANCTSPLAGPSKTYGTMHPIRESTMYLPALSDQHPLDETSSRQTEDVASVHTDGEAMKPEAFYKLIGLRPPRHSDYGACLADLEVGNGLYHDIRTSHIAMTRAHFWFEIGIYSALLGQVLLSANFIILGAMRGDHHVPIAILGAFSVSIAGCLALVKGQGLPMRLRIVRNVAVCGHEDGTDDQQERDALWEVQVEAEELHWQVAAGRAVLFGDVKRLWERFIQVKKDASINHPDTWTTTAAAMASPVGPSRVLPVTQPPPAAVSATAALHNAAATETVKSAVGEADGPEA